MRRRIVIPLVVVALLATSGTTRAPAQDERARAPVATPRTVTVLAAASLNAAFQSAATAFRRTHPDLTVQFSFAGSSSLVQQIHEGAPADVFASADEANMQKLVAAGMLTGAPQIFATNRLQIVVPAANPKHIASLADLTKPGLTVALCAPVVPCGHYATETFQKAGLTVPTASQEVDVKAVLGKVSMGEADAGIVYVTDVRAGGNSVTSVDIPTSANVTARYPIAILKGAANTAGAGAFVDFILSTEGQQVLKGFGFAPR